MKVDISMHEQLSPKYQLSSQDKEICSSNEEESEIYKD